MQIEIKKLSAELLDTFYALATEYLPDTERENAERMRTTYPGAFLVLQVDGMLCGLAYGWARAESVPGDPSFTLQGICVRSDFWRMGFGTRLLRQFETQAAAYASPVVGVGSAPGYAELFYLANGYTPVCYKTFDPKGRCHVYPLAGREEYQAFDRAAFARTVNGNEGFVVFEKAL